MDAKPRDPRSGNHELCADHLALKTAAQVGTPVDNEDAGPGSTGLARASTKSLT